MQEFLHHLRTIQFALTFVCYSIDVAITSISADSYNMGWFLLPDNLALIISGYYVITITKQWNKNVANEDIALNVFLMVLWIIYASSKAYVYTLDWSKFSLITVVYGWFNVGLYIVTSIIYCCYFQVDSPTLANNANIP